MTLLDVLVNCASILLTKVQHCIIHVEPLIPGILERHGYTSLPALMFNRLFEIPLFFPSPSLDSLYTRFSQRSKAMSQESSPELHVKRAYYNYQITMINHCNALKLEKILG